MEWRTANDLGKLEEVALGSWTRDELDRELESSREADAQHNRVIGAQQAVRTKRERGTMGTPKRGQFPCPECGSTLSTPGARGAHRERVHGVRSLRSA